MPKHINNRFNWIDDKESKLEKKPKLGSTKSIIRSAGWSSNYISELPIPKDRFK
jgi:hypothetical protein